MTAIEANIKKAREIKGSSLNTYISALKAIEKKVNNKSTLENTDFLKNFDNIKDILKNDKITSKKNRLTAIIVALHSDNTPDINIINKYSEHLRELTDEYGTFLKQQKKTDTQKNNWIEYDELIDIVNKIMIDIKENDIQNKTELNNKEFEMLQDLIILRTYLSFPLRNNFSNMEILNIDEYNNLDDNIKNVNNYLVLDGEEKYFYINQFKNKKFIGSKILQVNDGLNKIINLWLKFNNSGYYLVMKNRKTPINSNGITKYLNKIFKKLTNKKISSSMIRHIIISNVLKDKPTIEEQEQEEQKIEDTFFHNKNMNDLYRKID